ncbi:VOC family protein [Bdellovibrio sp. 22V]|uniref:VOC family protein n=1 Tax=Bdellovibrio sp. 22V TaxID=3044166 RepID=UPI002542C21B|nr:VOC family protein [Bdellovibrio sp. 22V]WII71149.1 VOC family protein [Bdellovibrio sp. 22V]
MTAAHFHSLAQEFLQKLFSELQEHQVQIEEHWDIDHLCYRVSSIERYVEMKKSFASFADLLIESDVNGRPIATYKLHSAVPFMNWSIEVVELPAPKPTKPTPEGFEHIEVVCDMPLAHLMEKYKALKMDHGGLAKDFNQELEICLGERNLKFHLLSLNSVINLEKNQRVYKALKESRILKDFKKYDPLVAGTFPLDIATAGSDLDILLRADDLSQIEQELREHYSEIPDFKVQKLVVDGLDTLMANFRFDEIPFEIFVQNRETVQQKAYRHFLAEERLLKCGGWPLKRKIQLLRAQKIKTEPAFAQALGIQGDAYAEILNLQKESQGTLQKRVQASH